MKRKSLSNFKGEESKLTLPEQQLNSLKGGWVLNSGGDIGVILIDPR